jgi:phosphopantothenoylcysteine decarboxylase/phosphopantothenate--cysteine ligase
MTGPRILLIVGGGIAAYKACELVRLIRKGTGGTPGEVTCVLTDGGAKFVTPLSLAALSENQVHTTLWDLKNEVEMGHIQLSRQADLIVVCPATADLLAKMAGGIADDLATTLLLATDKPVLAVPAMNVRMWQHAATIRNVATLRESGVTVLEPDEGAMACGEYGPGRLPEPFAVWQEIGRLLGFDPGMPEPGFILPEPGGEADYQESEDTGLGGLSAGLIGRTSKSKGKKAGADEEILADQPDFEGTDAPPIEEAPDFVPEKAGPLLAKKGRARAAPPTDAEAINHLVSRHGDAAAPQPFPEEMGAAAMADPLAGQDEFDWDPDHRPLFGKHVLVTAGPTHEPIDPVRYIANRSSGKQGFAIAGAAAAAGARVTLVAGPVNLPTPRGVDRIDVETATEMAAAVKSALPADVGIMVAAVADWRVSDVATSKMKKRGAAPPALRLTENPDILAATAGSGRTRPKLLVGFAAETDDVLANAAEKRKRKGVDWIVANDVSGDVMGGDANVVHIVTANGTESLPEMAKRDVARALVEKIADALAE